MFAWLLPYVYVLGVILDFVIVVFQSGGFEHVYVFAWWFLYVYVFGDVLDFVILLFQSGVFKYILVCSGWGGGGGLLCMFAKRIDIRRENCIGGLYEASVPGHRYAGFIYGGNYQCNRKSTHTAARRCRLIV